MKGIELFAGIGGIALAAERAGIETVAFCERDLFCQKVLKKHWPDVPIFDDIRVLDRQVLEKRGVNIEAIELISGGFPCQPYSIAGKRRGQKDDRDLWSEMFRVISEVRPTWVVGENVANFVNMGLDNTLSDLESIGYTCQSFIIPACAVGARHRRDRTFIVAHADSKYVEGSKQKEIQRKPGLQRFPHYGSVKEWSERSTVHQPKLLRSFNGIPDQVDRIRSLGNAVVPQQIYPIFKAIMEVS